MAAALPAPPAGACATTTASPRRPRPPTGTHASPVDLLLVNTGATRLTGVVPVPGRIGAAEASLVAVGVPHSAALAAALVRRRCTCSLPPVWGRFSLWWLGRHGYV